MLRTTSRAPRATSWALILAVAYLVLLSRPVLGAEPRTVGQTVTARPVADPPHVPPAARDYALSQSDFASLPAFGGIEERRVDGSRDGPTYFRNRYTYRSPDPDIVESTVALSGSGAEADEQYGRWQRRITQDTDAMPESLRDWPADLVSTYHASRSGRITRGVVAKYGNAVALVEIRGHEPRATLDNASALMRLIIQRFHQRADQSSEGSSS